MIEETLYALLQDTLDISVQQNTISEDKASPYCWFQRRSTVQDVFLDGTKSNLLEAFFDVEICGNSAVNSQAQTLRNALNGYRTSPIAGIFISDQSDDYQFKNMDADEGFHVAAISLRIFYYEG